MTPTSSFNHGPGPSGGAQGDGDHGVSAESATPNRRRLKAAWPFFPRRRNAVLITDAPLAPGQDRRRREYIYGGLMFLRVPSLLIAMYLVYAHSMWLTAAVVVGVTFPLPWAAVVIANGRGPKRDERERNVYKPALARQMKQARQAELAGEHGRQLPSGPETIDHDNHDAPVVPNDPERTTE